MCYSLKWWRWSSKGSLSKWPCRNPVQSVYQSLLPIFFPFLPMNFTRFDFFFFLNHLAAVPTSILGRRVKFVFCACVRIMGLIKTAQEDGCTNLPINAGYYTSALVLQQPVLPLAQPVCWVSCVCAYSSVSCGSQSQPSSAGCELLALCCSPPDPCCHNVSSDFWAVGEQCWVLPGKVLFTELV